MDQLHMPCTRGIRRRLAHHTKITLIRRCLRPAHTPRPAAYGLPRTVAKPKLPITKSPRLMDTVYSVAARSVLKLVM